MSNHRFAPSGDTSNIRNFIDFLFVILILALLGAFLKPSKESFGATGS
jgi:hypothetical protein